MCLKVLHVFSVVVACSLSLDACAAQEAGTSSDEAPAAAASAYSLSDAHKHTQGGFRWLRLT